MKQAKRVVVTHQLPGGGVSLLKQAGFQVRVHKKSQVLSQTSLLRLVRGADGILSELIDKIDERVLVGAGKQLKVVANYAVGFDNIDLKVAKARNIVVTNTPGVLTEAVAEHTVALMLGVARRVVEGDQYLRAGKYRGWEPDLLLSGTLVNKTLGIFGLGRIGKAVAMRCHLGFGMNILYHTPTRDEIFEAEYRAKYESADYILRHADFISLHVPLSSKTRHLIDARALKKMKPTAYLVNTSRGPVVDEKALAQALKKKQIAGAGLDVFEFEPKLAPGLDRLSNAVLTPHIASATYEAREEMSALAAKNIIAVLHGKKPLTPVP